MKKALLLLFLLIPFLGFSQKIKKNEIDKFDNSRIISTSQESIFAGSLKAIYKLWMDVMAVVREDGTTVISLNFATNVETSVYEGNKITFLFENGDKVEIEAEYSYILDHFYVNSLGMPTKLFGVSPSYYLTKGSPEIDKLINNKVTDIRIECRDTYVSYPINKKGAEKLKKCISIVIDEINK